MNMFAGAVAALGTMHGKERVITPTLDAQLGLRVELMGGLDTDRFGTFTREIPRVGTPRETARAKARHALQAHGHARFGLSSEGSFGPHPYVPFFPGGVEMVLLVDSETSLELVGIDITMETNFGSSCVTSIDEALSFADKASFPSHGLIVIAGPTDKPDPELGITKGIVAPEDLELAVHQVLRLHGRAWIETDMRAHVNPTRMKSIDRAVLALARAAKSLCPACARPGYVATKRVDGLPCVECEAPTGKARAEIFECAGCDRREERSLEGQSYATAYDCPQCNP